jgi:hypothetical protein
MTGVIDKNESRRIRAEIKRVLLEVWDPIGVKQVGQAQDEYDSYVGGVYELLVGGPTDNELQAYLWRIVKELMELPATIEDMTDTVKSLRNIPLNAEANKLTTAN